MNEAIAKMLEKYSSQSLEDRLQALREIMQEVALLGLWRGKFFEQFGSRSFFTDCYNYRRLHSRCHSRLQWFWFCNGSRYEYFACNSPSSRCASCPNSGDNGEHEPGAASLERHRLLLFTLVACGIAPCYPLWAISAC